jgi:excisionase family DNA binding protein
MTLPQREHKSWVTVGRVAEYCLVTPVTVRRWIQRDKLIAIRLPSGHYRISIEDFRDFLERYHMPIKEELFKSESEKKGGD